MVNIMSYRATTPTHVLCKQALDFKYKTTPPCNADCD